LFNGVYSGVPGVSHDDVEYLLRGLMYRKSLIMVMIYIIKDRRVLLHYYHRYPCIFIIKLKPIQHAQLNVDIDKFLAVGENNIARNLVLSSSI
jgi:hypothetical protein